jgi:tetratricopeptide (TPR) repeat protein
MKKLSTLLAVGLVPLCVASLAPRARAGEGAAAGGEAKGEVPARPKLEFETGKIIKKVVTRHDPGQSYALYLPKNYDPAKKWPILYGFSPGARGSDPVWLFKPAAEKYGWIVVGSNNSRNGPWQPIAAAIKAVMKDTEARLAIDRQRRYTTGFSGGARVGFHVAAQHGFAGTIPVGAGMAGGQKQPAKGKLAVFSICGQSDFNHAELLQLESRLRKAGVRNRMATFEGGHQWANRELCGAALRYMDLLWQLGLETKNQDRIKAILALEKRDAEKLLKTEGQYMRGHGRLKELVELSKDQGLAKKLSEVEATEKYKKEKALSDELAKIHAELARIADGDERFRKSVRRYMKFVGDNAGSEAAARLTVMLRSTATRMQMGASVLMRRKDYKRAEVYLKRARLFAPKSNGLAYNLACALARNGKKDQAVKMLAEAVKLGFTKYGHIKKDPDLESLREEPGYKKIVGAAGAGAGAGDPGEEKKPKPIPLL